MKLTWVSTLQTRLAANLVAALIIAAIIIMLDVCLFLSLSLSLSLAMIENGRCSTDDKMTAIFFASSNNHEGRSDWFPATFTARHIDFAT